MKDRAGKPQANFGISRAKNLARQSRNRRREEDLTTKGLARHSRNRKAEYLAQRTQRPQRKKIIPDLAFQPNNLRLIRPVADLARLARGISESEGARSPKNLRKPRKLSRIVVQRSQSKKKIGFGMLTAKHVLSGVEGGAKSAKKELGRSPAKHVLSKDEGAPR